MPSDTDTLARRTTDAAQWRLAAAVVGAASQFGVGVLLARLLTPADFGIVALAVTVTAAARPIGDLGIGAAIVQRAVLTARHVRVGFTCSALLGLATAAVIAAAAPLGAMLMRDAVVTPVLRALSLGFAIGGASVVANALVRRELDFRRLFYIEIGGYLFGYGVIAVSLSLLGYGVWSLVWGSLVQTGVATVAQLIVERHPMRPLLAWPELADLLRFGAGSAANGWVNYFALNGDNVVVARTLGAASLGLYNRAYALMNLPFTYTASVISGVLFPAFAQVQDDPVRLRRGYLLATRLTAVVAAPAMGILAIGAPSLVPAVYGPRWSGVVVPLQTLCVAGYFRALYHLGGAVTQSVGRVYSELWRQIVYAVLVVGGAWIGSRYGLGGVAFGVALAIVYMFVASAQLALRVTGTTWTDYAAAQAGALAVGAATCATAAAIRVVMEARGAASGVIALAIVAGAAAPWAAGLVWTLADPAFAPVRERLGLIGARVKLVSR